MQPVTSDDVRGWSNLDWDDLNYPVPTPPATDRLDVEVARARAYVIANTGLVEADITDGSDQAVRFGQAVQLRTEQQVTQRQPGYVADQNENAVDITVTGYAQRRVDTKQQNPRDMINPWPELNDLLIGLMTDDMRAYWESLGKIVVAMAEPVESIDDIGFMDPTVSNPDPWA